MCTTSLENSLICNCFTLYLPLPIHWHTRSTFCRRMSMIMHQLISFDNLHSPKKPRHEHITALLRSTSSIWSSLRWAISVSKLSKMHYVDCLIRLKQHNALWNIAILFRNQWNLTPHGSCQGHHIYVSSRKLTFILSNIHKFTVIAGCLIQSFD